MVPHEDPKLGRLLAGRDEPSVLETDEVLERVLAQAGSPEQPAGPQVPNVPVVEAPSEPLARPVISVPARTPRKALPMSTLVLAAAAVLLLWLHRAAPRDQGAFTGRGGAGGAGLVVHCLDGRGQAGACRAGATLAFEVEPPPERPHLSLFLVHPDRRVTWYVPEADGQSPSVQGEHLGRAWSRRAQLEASLRPGKYEVMGVFTARAMDRAALKAALPADLQSNAQIWLVSRPLVIEASAGVP